MSRDKNGRQLAVCHGDMLLLKRLSVAFWHSILSVPTTALGFPLALEAGTVPFATLGHRDV